jgi:hypothetical protein
MILVLLCLVSWVLFKSFCDAILFGKNGEDCHEVWHIVDWCRSWIIPLYAIYLLGLYHNLWLMVLLVAGSFMFNLTYRMFRVLNVYRIDNKFRWYFLGKILGRGGII